MKTRYEKDMNAGLICDTLGSSEQSRSKHQYSTLAAEKRVSCSSSLGDQIEEEVVELLRQHMSALSRYAAAMSRDRTIVQDAIQEAFLRYFIARSSGKKIENARAWLFRVLKNYVLDCNRKSGFALCGNMDEADEISDSRQDVEAKYEQAEMFKHAISLLSPREQECVHLRIEGFGYNEIAEILQIRSGTVGALLTRALKKIRKSGLYQGNNDVWSFHTPNKGAALGTSK